MTPPQTQKDKRVKTSGAGAHADEGGLRRRIEARAYSLFLERGQHHGRDLEDWLEAERQVREESSRSTARMAASQTSRERSPRSSSRPRPAGESRGLRSRTVR